MQLCVDESDGEVRGSLAGDGDLEFVSFEEWFTPRECLGLLGENAFEGAEGTSSLKEAPRSQRINSHCTSRRRGRTVGQESIKWNRKHQIIEGANMPIGGDQGVVMESYLQGTVGAEVQFW